MSNWLATSFAALIAQIVLQIVCGVILHLSYSPAVGDAHASVEAIRSGGFSQFLQNFHYWGSSVLIVHSFVHLAAMVWNGMYRPPHGLRFFAAIAIFLCAFLFQLTGNLLPMDRHDVQTAVIEAGIGRGMPVVGSMVGDLILQGDTFSQNTLNAWYLVHRWLLPPLILFAIAAVIIAHRRLQDSKMNPLGAAVPAVLVAILGFAVAAPSGAAAQPVDFGEYNALVSWYTWPMHGALRAFQNLSADLGWIGAGVLPGLLVGFLVLLPILRDRVSLSVARIGFAGLVGVFLLLGAGFGGSFAPLTGNQDPPETKIAEAGTSAPIDQALALKGKELFNTLDCAGCHGKDGVGDGAPSVLDTYKKHPDAEWYIKFVKSPKSVKPASRMPDFPELKNDQLAALAEYLRAPDKP